MILPKITFIASIPLQNITCFGLYSKANLQETNIAVGLEKPVH